jgi:hypothetical protein
VLAERLPGSDLQSLLLEVFRQRSPRRAAAELLAHRERDETVSPAPVDGRRVHEVEALALSDRKERLFVSAIGTEMLARFLAPG